MSGLWCSLLVVLICGSFTHAYKYGAPDYICKMPFPVHHSFAPQTTACPFTLSAKVADEDNGIVKIRIHSSTNSTSDYFKGYFVQVKNIASFLDNSYPTGAFTLDHARGTVHQCQDEKTSFVTHDMNVSKSSIDINWQAPSGFTGEVVFTSTIVVSYSLFWMNVESLPIVVSRKMALVKNGTDQPFKVILAQMHKGCGQTKNCLYTPEYCLTNDSCDALLTIKPLNGTNIFEIEMFSKNAIFVAMGISADFGMGADAVTDCVFEKSAEATEESDGIVKVYRSWNQPRRKENERLNDSSGIELIRGLYENKTIYCKIHMKPVFKIYNYNFDLNKNWYYVTLASGENLRHFRDSKPGIHFHNKYRVSPEGRYYLSAITADPNDEFFYGDCGNGTLCHGDPGTCVHTKNCRFAGKVRVQDHKFIVSLLAHKAQYVALGFTADHIRGDDHIVMCLNNNTQVQTSRSWNVPGIFDNRQMGRTGLQLLNGRLLKDGGLECTVIFDPSVIPSFMLDLEYQFILAAGSTVQKNKIGYHDLARSINNENIGLYTDSPQEDRDKLFYMSCGENRTCIGHPDRCIDSKSCDYAVSMAPDNVENIFSFHIIGNKSPGYVAVGLSKDKFMGDDLVVECVNLNRDGEAKAFLSYTEKANEAPKRHNEKYFIPTYGSFNNEKLECMALIEHPRFKIGNKTFDLLNDKFYLMLAVGTLDSGVTPDASANLLNHDVLYTVSSQAETLQTPKTLRERSRVLIHIHAILMIISWLALSGLGVFIARYYKSSGENVESTLSYYWLKWHKYCMGLASTLTIIGVVVIYSHCGKIILSGPASNHALFGFITSVLVFFQPLVAMFRPKPGTTGRIFFNTFHSFIGNLLHLIAICTIFLAVDLPEARLPQLTYWILAAYLVHHVLIHLLMTVANDMEAYQSDEENKIKKKENGNVLKGSQGLNEYLISSTPTKFKSLVFKYHSIITLALALFVVAIVLREYVFHT